MQILRLSPRPIGFRNSGGGSPQSVLLGPPENSDVSSSLRTLSSNIYKNCLYANFYSIPSFSFLEVLLGDTEPRV